MKRGPKPADLSGQKFGRLTVVKNTGKPTSSPGSYFWLCRCECGRDLEVSSITLKGGKTSCGCQTGKSRRQWIF